jgi:hypothetical protein
MKTLQAVKFLFIGPIILGFLFILNWMTSPGDWWVQWPALGIGIAWFISLFRVIVAVVAVGGIAAFIAYLSRR